MQTEGSSLIAHVQSSGKFTDEQLTKALMITPKRFGKYKEGELETPRSLTETLAILAEHVGYPKDALTKAEADAVRPNTHLLYQKERCLVLGVSKAGVLAPYFSLLGNGGIYTSVPYRLCSPDGAA